MHSGKGKTRSAWVTYPVALLSIGVAVLIRWLIDPLLGDQLQLITTYGGVAVAVWFGGWAPAALAAAIGLVAVDYLFIPPRHAFAFDTPAIWTSAISYAFSCGIIIYLGEAMRRARGRAEEHTGKLEETARRQAVLYRFVDRRQAAKSLAEIYESGLEAIVEALGCDCAAILLFDHAGAMRFVAWRNLSDSYRKKVEGYSPWKRDERNPQPIWISDVDAADMDGSRKQAMHNEGIAALGSMPLMAEGELIGQLVTCCCEPHVYTKDEIELSLNIARQLALGIERKRAEEKLHESEERLRLATQTGKVGVWEWDLAANSVTWTDSLFAIHGISKADFNATAEGATALVHPDDRELVGKTVERSIRQGSPYELTFRTVKPNGETVWIFTNAVVVQRDGKPVRVIGAMTDITELKRAEAALEQANRAKDQFLAALSHELRTPLTPVLMIASALEADRTIATDLREQLGMIRRNIQLEARLIDDLLDLSRIEHGKFELQKQDVDVHAVIEHALEVSAPDLKSKKLEITKNLNAANHFCSADPARLQEVFWNIIRNAAKFTPDGGKIDISTRNDHDSVIIECVDTGIGIEPELQPRIFEAFAQGDRRHSGGYGGLGLGLAISKRIVDLHEGTLEARSAGSGKGATFSIKLNTIDKPAAFGMKSDGTESAAALGKILIAEDHVDTAKVLRRILQNDGYAVTTCGSIHDAREAAAEKEFDLLISDIALPDGSGLDLMRELGETREMPGIALSGFGTEENVTASKVAGFAAHLTKPVDLVQLRETITSLLNGKPHEPREASA